MLFRMQEHDSSLGMPFPMISSTGADIHGSAGASNPQDKVSDASIWTSEAAGVTASLPAKTISAIIPAKNEGDVLLEVAESVRKYCDEVIIVDNAGHSIVERPGSQGGPLPFPW